MLPLPHIAPPNRNSPPNEIAKFIIEKQKSIYGELFDDSGIVYEGKKSALKVHVHPGMDWWVFPGRTNNNDPDKFTATPAIYQHLATDQEYCQRYKTFIHQYINSFDKNENVYQIRFCKLVESLIEMTGNNGRLLAGFTQKEQDFLFIAVNNFYEEKKGEKKVIIDPGDVYSQYFGILKLIADHSKEIDRHQLIVPAREKLGESKEINRHQWIPSAREKLRARLELGIGQIRSEAITERKNEPIFDKKTSLDQDQKEDFYNRSAIYSRQNKFGCGTLKERIVDQEVSYPFCHFRITHDPITEEDNIPGVDKVKPIDKAKYLEHPPVAAICIDYTDHRNSSTLPNVQELKETYKQKTLETLTLYNKLEVDHLVKHGDGMGVFLNQYEGELRDLEVTEKACQDYLDGFFEAVTEFYDKNPKATLKKITFVTIDPKGEKDPRLEEIFSKKLEKFKQISTKKILNSIEIKHDKAGPRFNISKYYVQGAKKLGMTIAPHRNKEFLGAALDKGNVLEEQIALLSDMASIGNPVFNPNVLNIIDPATFQMAAGANVVTPAPAPNPPIPSSSSFSIWHVDSKEKAQYERTGSGEFAIASPVYDAPTEDTFLEQFPYRQEIRGDGLCYLNCCLVDILHRCVGDKDKWNRFKENIKDQPDASRIINQIEGLASKDGDDGLLDRGKLYVNVLSVKGAANPCTQLVKAISNDLHPKLIIDYEVENKESIEKLNDPDQSIEENAKREIEKNLSFNLSQIEKIKNAISTNTFLGIYDERKINKYVELLTAGLARDNQSSLSTYSYNSENQGTHFDGQDNPDFIITYNPGIHFDLMFNKLHPVYGELNPEMASQAEIEYQRKVEKVRKEQSEIDIRKAQIAEWKEFMCTLRDDNEKKLLIESFLTAHNIKKLDTIDGHKELIPPFEKLINKAKADIKKEKVELKALKELISGNEALKNRIEELTSLTTNLIDETIFYDRNQGILDTIRQVVNHFTTPNSQEIRDQQKLSDNEFAEAGITPPPSVEIKLPQPRMAPIPRVAPSLKMAAGGILQTSLAPITSDPSNPAFPPNPSTTSTPPLATSQNFSFFYNKDQRIITFIIKSGPEGSGENLVGSSGGVGKFDYKKQLNAEETYNEGDYNEKLERDNILNLLKEASDVTQRKFQSLDDNFFIAVMKVASENCGISRIEEAKFNACFDTALKKIDQSLDATKYKLEEGDTLHKIAKYFSANFQELSRENKYLTARPGVPENTINPVGRRLFRVCTEENIKEFEKKLKSPSSSPASPRLKVVPVEVVTGKAPD